MVVFGWFVLSLSPSLGCRGLEIARKESGGFGAASPSVSLRGSSEVPSSPSLLLRITPLHQEENEALLKSCWLKLREGGALAGGFISNPSMRHLEMRLAVVTFAQEKLRQPFFGLTRKTPTFWLLRK